MQRGSSLVEVADGQPTKKPRAAAKPKRVATKDVGTCSMSKKEIGDRVKMSLALEKYHLNPSYIFVST